MTAQKRIAFNIALMGFVFYAINFLFNAYLARNLAGGLYGDFRVGLNTLMLAGMFLMLGTTSSTRKYLSGFFREKNIQGSAAYIGWNIRIIIVASLIFLLIATGVVLAIHGKDIKALVNYHLALQMLILAPLAGMLSLFAIYFQANFNLYRFGFLSQAAIYIMMAVLCIIAVEFLDLTLTSQTLWGIVLVSFALLVSMAETSRKKRMAIVFDEVSIDAICDCVSNNV